MLLSWRVFILSLALVVAHAPPVRAETDFSALSFTERAILGAEIRAVLLELPDLPGMIQGAPPPSPYQDQVAADLDLIATYSRQLFRPGAGASFGATDAPIFVALFITPDCPDCARAEAELRELATRTPIHITLHDMQADARLASVMGLDIAPSYVMSDRMLRGHMPAVVLERYFRE